LAAGDISAKVVLLPRRVFPNLDVIATHLILHGVFRRYWRRLECC